MSRFTASAQTTEGNDSEDVQFIQTQGSMKAATAQLKAANKLIYQHYQPRGYKPAKVVIEEADGPVAISSGAFGR